MLSSLTQTEATEFHLALKTGLLRDGSPAVPRIRETLEQASPKALRRFLEEQGVHPMPFRRVVERTGARVDQELLEIG